MKTKAFAAAALKLALLYGIVVGPCEGIQAQPSTQQARPAEVRFRIVHESIAIVSVLANEDGPFDFILDTGAQTSVVDSAVVRELSLGIQSRIQQFTLTGTQAVPISAPAALTLGPAKVAGLHLLVQNLDSLRRVDPKIAGILGQDFLSNFNYLLDYRGHTVKFDEADTILNRMGGDRVPLEAGSKQMMLTAQADTRAGAQATLRLLLDSGATSMVLMGSESNQLKPLVQGMALKTALQITSIGEAAVKTGQIHALRIGQQQFHDLPTALTARPNIELTQDGLVPMAIFHAIYVDNRDKFVILNPRLNKD